MQKIFLLIGIFLAFISVALGAFGAHALKNKLSLDLLNAFEVGVRYQMYHALALMLIAILYSQYNSSLVTASFWFMTAGVCLFSGSLYMLAFTGIRLFGAITPVGGSLLLLGWLLLALGLLNHS